MVTLTEISKEYAGHTALNGIDLTIEDSRVTALIGPSGCGKSTLLRIVLGLIEPTSGTVEIDGNQMDPTRLDLRHAIGYVVQDGGLFPHLTGNGNVALLARYLQRSEPWITERIANLANLARLPLELLNRYPSELSGGQRQRISLMRALMLEPKLLLLDEPLAALDPIVRASLQTDLKEIFAELKQTVVFVTHDMGEASYLADRIVLLREGRIIQKGSVKDFSDHPAEPFVTEFMNAQRTVGAIA